MSARTEDEGWTHQRYAALTSFKMVDKWRSSVRSEDVRRDGMFSGLLSFKILFSHFKTLGFDLKQL